MTSASVEGEKRLFPVAHSLLHPVALAEEVKRRYGLQGDVACTLVSRGINDIYAIQTETTRYALRVAGANSRTPAARAYEFDLVTFLERAGIPVAGPVPDRSGALHFAVEAPEGSRTISLQRWVSGKLLSAALTEDAAFRCGLVVGDAHAALRSFRPAQSHPGWNMAGMRDRLPFLLRMVRNNGGDVGFYESLVVDVMAAMERVDGMALPRGDLHGDVHIDNAMIEADGTLVLLDFDNCGEDILIKELVNFVWRNRYLGHPEAINAAFIAGYDSRRPLAAPEREQLPLLIVARDLFIFSAYARNVQRDGFIGAMAHSYERHDALTRAHAREAGLI